MPLGQRERGRRANVGGTGVPSCPCVRVLRPLEECVVYRDQLAHTGTGVVVVGGLTLTGWWLIALALAAVVMGAACVRYGYRRGASL